MSYQALYRVWRPKQFSDVVGQTHITQTLKHAIEQEKFSHEYVFSGPRGTGKTSAAKISDKNVNCENEQGGKPCNECGERCSIKAGTNSDVIEICDAFTKSDEDVR